jgi:hypothetical protein
LLFELLSHVLIDVSVHFKLDFHVLKDHPPLRQLLKHIYKEVVFKIVIQRQP